MKTVERIKIFYKHPDDPTEPMHTSTGILKLDKEADLATILSWDRTVLFVIFLLSHIKMEDDEIGERGREIEHEFLDSLS